MKAEEAEAVRVGAWVRAGARRRPAGAEHYEIECSRSRL